MASGISVFGAAQGSPEITAANDDAEAGSPTIQTNITTSTDGAWIFDAVGSGQAVSFTADCGVGCEFDDQTGGTSGGAGSCDVNWTADSHQLGWTTRGASNRISHVLAPWAPSSSSSGVQTEAEFAHILALRYKEPGTTLGPEE